MLLFEYDWSMEIFIIRGKLVKWNNKTNRRCEETHSEIAIKCVICAAGRVGLRSITSIFKKIFAQKRKARIWNYYVYIWAAMIRIVLMHLMVPQESRSVVYCTTQSVFWISEPHCGYPAQRINNIHSHTHIVES